MKRGLIVIGLDGATFDIMDPLLEQGQLPALAQLLSNGTSARLLSTIPYATIPAWPSFMTASNPGKHGVFDFFTVRGTNRRISTSQDIRSPTLWELLSAQEKRCVVMNVPATFPPKPINGVLVSGMLTPADARFASPGEVVDFLHRETDGYRVNFRSHLTGRHLVRDAFEVTEKQKRGFLALLRAHDWDFAMIMFRATDVIPHHFWDRQDLIQECYSRVDSCIGDITRAFPEAVVFVISDHGLQGQYRDFHVNKWLIDQGYMAISRGWTTNSSRWEQIRGLEGRQELAQAQLRPSPVSRLLLRLGLTGHRLRKAIPLRLWRLLKNSIPASMRHHVPAGEDIIYDVDWDRTLASAYQLYATESKAVTILNLDHRSREALCTEIANKLQGLLDPLTGKHIVRRVHRREELYSGPYVDHAPDIILDLHDGYNITNAFFADDYVTERDQVRGCHHREGIFIACGANISRGDSLAAYPSLMDVMPTVMHYLGAAIPRDCDGRVLTEIYHPHSESAERPVKYLAVSDIPSSSDARTLGIEQQAEIEERLRALGYL